MPITRTGARAKLLGALFCTFTFAACGPSTGAGTPEGDSAPVGQAQKPVVYGTDNRTDVYAHADATLRTRAQQSTVALMSAGDIDTSNPNNVAFFAATLQEAYDLCSSQRFLNDPTPAFCSGTLIDDDLVLTAGHCVTTASECNSTRFVFKFYKTAATSLETVTTADIFSCQSIVARQEAVVNGRNLDFAVLRLDRAATPRFTPAPIRAGNTAMGSGANVAVIGSGSGIPFKIDSGGAVRDGRSATLDYFVANTDTFGGNSGSGVYETSGYTVAGILVRGEQDYVASGSCYIVKTCTETGCRGEDITYVRPAIDAYCAAASSQRLCGTTNPPPPPASSLTYNATNTSSATQNTSNKVIALTAGQKVTLGTCGLTGATFTGDTFLRLMGPAGTEVVSNDDGCGGRGSNMSFTVPAGAGGNYELRAGCYSSGTCGGTVIWTITNATSTGGSFAFSASNTNSAQQNTTNRDVALTAGQTLNFGTCTVPGASGTGDTFLRLYSPSGQLVTSNDDACGALSYGSYVVPAGAGGTYQIRAGCYSSNACSGTVAYTVQ